MRKELAQAGYRPSEGLCGLRNLAVVALPMVAMCDSRDISGVVDSKNLGSSRLILYDRYPGGLGYCEKGFSQIETLLAICHEMVAECACDGRLPQLRRTAQSAAGDPQRSGPDARLSDSEQSGHDPAAGVALFLPQLDRPGPVRG